jgi:cytochrome P450 monooxygenase
MRADKARGFCYASLIMSGRLFARAVRYRDGFPIAAGGLPWFGHSPSIYSDSAAFYRRCRDTLGPLFWVHHGFGNWMLMCASPEGFELVKNRTVTSDHYRRDAGTFVGDSLIGHDGTTHARMRAGLNTPFTPKGLTSTRVGSIVVETMTSHIEGWAARRSITVLRETRQMTLRILCRTIGVSITDLDEWSTQYGDFVYSVFPYIPKWIPGSPTVKAERARSWLDEHLLTIIREVRAQPNDGSFISEMVHGHDEEGRTLTDMELVDNLRLLMLAGHETEATTLAWITFTLATRPDLWAMLCEEAGRAESLPLTPQDLRAYPFAEALFREAVRYYSPVSFVSRTLIDPITLCGHQVPAGTIVALGLAGLARDPTLFPDPDNFNPARWLGRKEPPSPLETAAFGGGIHFCLGYHLAWLEGVQFGLALARQLMKRGLRLRMPDGAAPHHYYLPLGHPTRSARVEIV